MADLLSDEDVASRLEGSDWKREGDEIVREWKFKDFGEAMSFVNRVAEAAEEANHHPDILLHGWNKVQAVADQPLGRRADRRPTSRWPISSTRSSALAGDPGDGPSAVATQAPPSKAATATGALANVTLPVTGAPVAVESR